MTRYAVVAYPRLSAGDAAWVESVRAIHDPQFALIRAHFTLVFPVAASADMLTARVAACISGRGSFEVILTSAAAHRDEEGDGSHVFLFPSAGARELVELHEAMYATELRRHLRPDIPYTPHVTVAHKRDHAACLALADDLNRQGISLVAGIDAVDIITLDAAGITSLARMPLGA